jgi:hypothetical protein
VIAGFAGGLLLLLGPGFSPAARWNGVGAIAVAVVTMGIMSGKVWPGTILRRTVPPEAPSFEVGDPNDPDPDPGTPSLIRAMHRVRGQRKRPPL